MLHSELLITIIRPPHHPKTSHIRFAYPGYHADNDMAPNSVHPSKRDGSLRLAAAIHESSTASSTPSLRTLAARYGVSKSTLHRRLNAKNSTLRPRGRQKVFTEAEERIILDAVLYFSDNLTPLSRDCFKDVVALYISKLPSARVKELPFRNGYVGDWWMRKFISRHPKLMLRRRANLEQSRALAMSPENLAKHYARLAVVYKEYNISNAAQIFNLDESGCSVRTAHRSRAKALFNSAARTNSRELKWSGNAEHVTVMPVVSADGTVYSPVVILPGKMQKSRTRADGRRETPADFLPSNALVAYREPAGVDSTIFFNWVQRFIIETKSLRERFRYILLTFDGYGAHVSFRALQLLKDHRIIVVGLPAHTSHRTQVLDYTVFSAFKTSFRNLLNHRAATVSYTQRNDVYTVCELLHTAYKKSLTYDNITKGFKCCGIWCPRRKSVVPEVINERDITNWTGYRSQGDGHIGFMDLVQEYQRSAFVFASDGDILLNGTLNTTAGELLTRDEVLRALRVREEKRVADEKSREERVRTVLEKRSAREEARAQRERDKHNEAQRVAEHAIWLSSRADRSRLLTVSRRERRATARLRANA